MHLDNKSLVFLASPFIIAGGIWLFAADSMIEGLSAFFEPVEQQRIPVLEEKKEMYTFIMDEKEPYSSLLTKIQMRYENRFWICERLYQPYTPKVTSMPTLPLALKLPPPLLGFVDKNITVPISVTPTWSVQMILPDQNIAVINNQIYHVGQSSGGVKLLEVTSSKIYIQTSKGKQWVKLFH